MGCALRPDGQVSAMSVVPDHPEPDPLCPKRMVYGPCGGVRADLTCEMRPQQQCPFTAKPAPSWAALVEGDEGRALAAQMRAAGFSTVDSEVAPGSLLALAAERPVVLTDFTVRPYDPTSVAEVTRELAGSCDALLVGEHNNRPDFPPALLMPMIREQGGRAWVTLTCRDRNRVVLEQELAALSALNGDGVLCVTGDGRGVGVRPGVTSVFDLDSLRLVASARETGLATAVAESPEAPPTDQRPYRLAQKQRAGAQVCFVNHVSTPERLARFVGEARAAGCTLPFIAGVAVYTDERSARVLQSFPGLHLEAERVDAVLSAPDPIRAGIDETVREARAVLEIEGVVGVNISGLASDRGELAAAQIKAIVGREVLGR
jgi:methylenetetrahydrofolate reductase (NADPH)